MLFRSAAVAGHLRSPIDTGSRASLHGAMRSPSERAPRRDLWPDGATLSDGSRPRVLARRIFLAVWHKRSRRPWSKARDGDRGAAISSRASPEQTRRLLGSTRSSCRFQRRRRRSGTSSRCALREPRPSAAAITPKYNHYPTAALLAQKTALDYDAAGPRPDARPPLALIPALNPSRRNERRNATMSSRISRTSWTGSRAAR